MKHDARELQEIRNQAIAEGLSAINRIEANVLRETRSEFPILLSRRRFLRTMKRYHARLRARERATFRAGASIVDLCREGSFVGITTDLTNNKHTNMYTLEAPYEDAELGKVHVRITLKEEEAYTPVKSLYSWHVV